MSGVRNDSEAMETFASQMTNFLDTVKDATNSLNYSFDTLGDTWQDEKRSSFESDYQELLNVLSEFENNSLEKIDYLRFKANQLREYEES
jgi:uncharacterized protein YukE